MRAARLPTPPLFDQMVGERRTICHTIRASGILEISMTWRSLLRTPRAIVSKTVFALLSRWPHITLYYNLPEKTAIIQRVREIKAQCELLLADDEAYQLVALLQAVAKIPGDVAEVGTYRGGSARLICEFKGVKALHLFDTFTGLPRTGIHDYEGFKEGQYSASVETVQRVVAGYDNVHVYPGLFPDTATPIADTQFSFVHLDVDLYEWTLEGLKYFYPRLAPGGIIITHDAITADRGASRAFHEFFADKKEPIIALSRSQAMIVKVGD